MAAGCQDAVRSVDSKQSYSWLNFACPGVCVVESTFGTGHLPVQMLGLGLTTLAHTRAHRSAGVQEFPCFRDGRGLTPSEQGSTRQTRPMSASQLWSAGSAGCRCRRNVLASSSIFMPQSDSPCTSWLVSREASASRLVSHE